MVNTTSPKMSCSSLSRRGFLRSGVAVALATALLMPGCAVVGAFKADAIRTIEITGVDLDEAFSKATRVAVELGYHITSSDKSGGTFAGQRGSTGYADISGINFTMDAGKSGVIAVTLRFASSVDNERCLNEFIQAYGKHVTIKN